MKEILKMDCMMDLEYIIMLKVMYTKEIGFRDRKMDMENYIIGYRMSF